MTRQIALLTNPTAGRGHALRERDAVVGRLVSRGLEVQVLTGRDAAESVELARKAVADGANSVVAMGGDGLVHAALQAVAGSGTHLGVIPTGTGNDFARSLGLPLKDPGAAAEVVAAGHVRRIDAARSGESWFGTVLAAGFDAAVNQRAEQMTWPHGNLRYTLALLAELRAFQPLPYTLVLDGREVQQSAMLVAVGNTDSFGGGIRMTHGALVDDGLLDVVVIKPVSKLELIKTYPKLFRGTHVTHPAFERHRVRTVTVAAPGIVSYADGERFGALPLTVECVPAAVSVLTRES